MTLHALHQGEGEAIWFAGNLATVKGTREQGGTWAFVEIEAPVGYSPPLHVHKYDDEAFYVLRGEMLVTCGDETAECAPGSYVFLPKAVPHGFEVVGPDPAKWLLLQSPRGDFTKLIREIGVRATSPTLPDSDVGIPDPAALTQAMRKYDIEFV